ncbi:MAG: nucleotidyltransferase domain-containing protein [Armatimonadetes bacterium]|nr:nucleotidyltransferase domain-containing protein [Armatimonadota bacterium]
MSGPHHERIAQWNRDSADRILEWANSSPHPSRALNNIERWLNAHTDPHIALDHLVSSGKSGEVLVFALGSSRYLGDQLVQNPELGSLALDSHLLTVPVVRQTVEEEGRRMMHVAQSTLHTLDRLRYLKQLWTYRLAICDLGGLREPRETWHQISELCDALLQLCFESLWKKFTIERNLENLPPPIVVAYGKLGGSELNYSSDVDLAYIADDGVSAEDLVALGRFCEMLNRALSDQMGRGMLYRVDLRLRPFGRSGPIVNRFAASEGYYQKYAEPWEILALVRSRVVIGDPSAVDRWNALRQAVCFKRARVDWFFHQIIEQRARTEAKVGSNDIKRGKGGIRDIEFFAQMHQILAGETYEDLQSRDTISCLRAISHHKLADRAHDLIPAYTLLRQTEHRLQLVDNAQTHDLPSDAEGLQAIAVALGFGSKEDFEAELGAARNQASETYRSLVASLAGTPETNEAVWEATFGPLRRQAEEFIKRAPDPAALLQTLREDVQGRERFNRLLRNGPEVLHRVMHQPEVLEQLITGEIEERWLLPDLSRVTSPALLAQNLRRLHTKIGVRAALGATPIPSLETQEVFDEILSQVFDPSLVSVIRLGSYASGEMGPFSDADLLLVANSEADLARAEDHAEGVLRVIAELTTMGSPFSLDLRLRPEGRQGLLVRTVQGIRDYRESAMEPWERLALVRSSLLLGEEAAIDVVRRAALSGGYSASDASALAYIKHRLETERCLPSEYRRHVKLGYGGLIDLEWLLHVAALVHLPPKALQISALVMDLISELVVVGFFNVAEAEELRQGVRHHSAMRWSLAAMGFEPDLLPENPDKLDALAGALGFESGNSLLRTDINVRESIRSMYQDGLRRLAP